MFFFTNEKIGSDVITISRYPFEKYNGMVIMKIATCNFTPCYMLDPGGC